MPFVFTRQSPVIGVWKIEESWQELLEMFQFKALVAADVNTIQSENRKREWLAVRLLVERLTSDDIPIYYMEGGAPFLKSTPYQISISHTKGYAAVILSRCLNPGIDIEYRSERAWKLRTKFLNDNELKQFDAIEPDLHATMATICWCAKETAYKTLQTTGVDFINHLHIEPFIVSETGVFTLRETKTANRERYAIHYQLTDDYIITWKE